MPVKSIYRTPEGQANIHAIYDRQLARLTLPYESRLLETRFGTTHVLAFGPKDGTPLVVLQGGNTTNPVNLDWIRPMLEKYRVYAPDTIGHPGKSAPRRLSANDDSYGKWLVDVLDGLGLQAPALFGGSYGAGILLRAAAYAPQRISKAILVIPSGLVSIPMGTMLSMLWWLGLYNLAPSRARLEHILWPMFKDEPVGEDVIEITEAVFRHVHIEPEMPRNVTPVEMAAFKAPTLVLAAERDGLFPAQAVVKRARQVFPNLAAAEIIPGATHFIGAAHHAALNERCMRFLEGAG